MMSKVSTFENVKIQKAPENTESVTQWCTAIKDKLDLQTNVSIETANENLYLLKHPIGNSEIYFFSNQDETEGKAFTATFTIRGKTV